MIGIELHGFNPNVTSPSCGASTLTSGAGDLPDPLMFEMSIYYFFFHYIIFWCF